MTQLNKEQLIVLVLKHDTVSQNKPRLFGEGLNAYLLYQRRRGSAVRKANNDFLVIVVVENDELLLVVAFLKLFMEEALKLPVYRKNNIKIVEFKNELLLAALEQSVNFSAG